MNSGSERVGGFIRDLGEAARRNPISAALIGMGAVWLLASRSERGTELIRRSGIDRLPEAARDAWEGTSSNLRSGARAVSDTVGETTDILRRQGSEAVDRITETGGRFARDAADYVEDLPDRAGSLFGDARDRLTDLFKSQPLAIGAAGLAIGAAIAASLPTTEAENEYLGESSELIKQKVGEIAGEQVEHATEVGKKVANAVADEARKQGFTTEGLKSAATDLSNKASGVAKAAPPSRP
jgi:hypothetical protein